MPIMFEKQIQREYCWSKIVRKLYIQHHAWQKIYSQYFLTTPFYQVLILIAARIKDRPKLQTLYYFDYFTERTIFLTN